MCLVWDNCCGLLLSGRQFRPPVEMRSSTEKIQFICTLLLDPSVSWSFTLPWTVVDYFVMLPEEVPCVLRRLQWDAKHQLHSSLFSLVFPTGQDFCYDVTHCLHGYEPSFLDMYFLLQMLHMEYLRMKSTKNTASCIRLCHHDYYHLAALCAANHMIYPSECRRVVLLWPQ